MEQSPVNSQQRQTPQQELISQQWAITTTSFSCEKNATTL